MTARPAGRVAEGASCHLQDLVGLRHAATTINPSRRNPALSVLAGPNKSNFRGRGIDFEEVRLYQPGDDIRGIDWRVTARTGDAHTKLFREERERPVMIVVDQRNSMFFGSINCLKSVLACQVASLLAWSCLHNNDRVGGLVFHDNDHIDTRPKRSRRSVLHLLSHMVDYNQLLPLTDAGEEDYFAHMLASLRRITRPGTSIYLVSDFLDADSTSAYKHLFQLARHNEITALHCSDPLESKMPGSGRYAITDGSNKLQIHTGDKTLRKRYAALHEQRLHALSEQMLQLGIPLIRLSTDIAPLTALQPYYGRQQR